METMEKYSLPRSIFYHIPEEEVARITFAQKGHATRMKNIESFLKRHGENKLSENAERMRESKRNYLQQRLNNNMGLPFSITSQLTEGQQLTLLYNIFNHHTRLKQTVTNRKRKNFEQDYLKLHQFVKKSHQHKENVYNSARERYFGIPMPPSTKNKNKASKSLRKKRNIKQIKKKKQQTELDKLIQVEMLKLIERQKMIKQKRMYKKPQRLIQSARPYTERRESKHKNMTNKSNFDKPKGQIQSARPYKSARSYKSARPHTERTHDDKQKKVTLLDEIMIYSGTKAGEKKFGSTVPQFIRKVTQFMEQKKEKSLKIEQELNQRFTFTNDNEDNNENTKNKNKRLLAKKSAINLFKICNGDLDLMDAVIDNLKKQKRFKEIDNIQYLKEIVPRIKSQMKPKWNDSIVTIKKQKRIIHTLLYSTDNQKLQKTSWLRRKAYSNVMKIRKQRLENSKLDKEIDKVIEMEQDKENKPEMNKPEIPILPLKDL